MFFSRPLSLRRTHQSFHYGLLDSDVATPCNQLLTLSFVIMNWVCVVFCSCNCESHRHNHHLFCFFDILSNLCNTLLSTRLMVRSAAYLPEIGFSMVVPSHGERYVTRLRTSSERHERERLRRLKESYICPCDYTSLAQRHMLAEGREPVHAKVFSSINLQYPASVRTTQEAGGTDASYQGCKCEICLNYVIKIR